MFQIDCPWCGKRNQSEFTYGSEAHIERSADPDSVTDEVWGQYLFARKNPKGWHQERWRHTFGCRRWFFAIRHTVTDRFWSVYKIDEKPPIPPEGWDGLLSKIEHRPAKASGN